MKTIKDLMKKQVNVSSFSEATKKQFCLNEKIFLSISPRDVLNGGWDVVDSYTTTGGHGPEMKGIKVMWVVVRDADGTAVRVSGTTHRQFSNGMRSTVIPASLEEVIKEKKKRVDYEETQSERNLAEYAKREEVARNQQNKDVAYCHWNLHQIDGVVDFEFTATGIVVEFENGKYKEFTSPSEVIS